MNDTVEPTFEPNDALASAGSDATLSATLERLSEWSDAFRARLDKQSTFFDVLEEQMLVELRTHYHDDFDPRFIRDMLDAALQRVINQQPLVYDTLQHAPYSPEGLVTQEIPETRRDVMAQLVESLATRMLDYYRDYLDRHWRDRPAALSEGERYDAQVRQRIEEHHGAFAALFAPQSLEGVTVETLRARIEDHQAAWHAQAALFAVSSEQERRTVGRLARTHLPDWLKGLDQESRASLQDSHLAMTQARQELDALLGDVQSLQSYARCCAKDYLREHLDREMEPDLIFVTRRLHSDPDAAPEKLTVSELVAEGPVEAELLYTLVEISGPVQHYQMPDVAMISQLLRDVDAPGRYLHALIDCHQTPDVKLAMFDVYEARLRHSALLARSAGHLAPQRYDWVRALWEGEPSHLQVCDVAPVDMSICSDMLLFYREDAAGMPEDLVLYVPDKPDGQEWIELPSLHAVNAEIGGWLKEASGRQYLIQQFADERRKSALELFARAVEKPTEWSLDRDSRGALRGYEACIEQGVAMRQLDRQAQVEQDSSPRWYSRMSIEERRVLCQVTQQARIHEKAFQVALGAYEPFVDFAKRTVREAITPYLLEKGIEAPVDPESILIEYSPSLRDGRLEVVNLLDLVCYGYDDNSGVDHPDRGVRSSVGQDLSQLRSADLANYARRAYVGEQYINEIRARFLDRESPEYAKRQRLFGQALLSAMDRDLRIAVDSQHISLDVYNRLTDQLTNLYRTLGRGSVESDSEAVAQWDGLFRCSVDDQLVLGVYVFRYIDNGLAYDWLYTPQAPDGVLLRRYVALNQVAASVLHDYVLDRVALAARASVRERLLALADGSMHRDAVREFRQVITVAGEFNAYIGRVLTDVDDATQSRVEVIEGQVFKGLVFALPLTLMYPPFALLLGSYFFVVPFREAIIAHTRGETAKALLRWLEASWGALGLVLSVPGVSFRMLKPLFVSLRDSIVPVRASAQRATAAVRSMKFKKGWAVKAPENLQEVTEEGLWKGTLRNASSSEAPGVEHFVRDRGRYYKVVRDLDHGTLRVVKANRPHSYYQEPIARTADGRWIPNKVGLRGGNSVEDLGQVTQLRQITRGSGQPLPERGAFQGEAVVARFNPEGADNYLYSLNAQTCVVVSLYNPTTKVGAVIHFDHNIKSLIERSVRDVLARLRGANTTQEVRAVMAGGDWLTGADIGGPVRSVLRRNGLQPSWEHWSYSSCFGNTYGLTLDLGTGTTSAYKTSQALVARLYDPVLASARFNAPGVAGRAHAFKARFRAEVLVEGRGGVVLDSLGQPAAMAEIEQQAIRTVVIG